MKEGITMLSKQMQTKSRKYFSLSIEIIILPFIESL